MILALKDAVHRPHRSVPSRAAISNQTAQIRTIWTEAERKRRGEMSMLLQLRLLAKCGEVPAAD